MKIIEYPSFAKAKAKRHFQISAIYAVVGMAAVLVGQLYKPFEIPSFVLLALALKWCISSLNTALNARQGQSGEDETAKVLSALGDEYCLIRNLQLGEKQGDIDFVLIGPFGALVLEQKALSTPVRCQGDHWSIQISPTFWRKVKSFSRQLNQNLRAVKKLIKAPCYGTIVFNNHIRLTITDPTVSIIRRKELLNYIKNLPVRDCDTSQLTQALQTPAQKLAA